MGLGIKFSHCETLDLDSNHKILSSDSTQDKQDSDLTRIRQKVNSLHLYHSDVERSKAYFFERCGLND